MILKSEVTMANTLYVGGSNPGNYSTIQNAIDAANPGNTIYVYSGTYIENILIDKTLRRHKPCRLRRRQPRL